MADDLDVPPPPQSALVIPQGLSPIERVKAAPISTGLSGAMVVFYLAGLLGAMGWLAITPLQYVWAAPRYLCYSCCERHLLPTRTRPRGVLAQTNPRLFLARTACCSNLLLPPALTACSNHLL
jgi:hypothetical protein